MGGKSLQPRQDRHIRTFQRPARRLTTERPLRDVPVLLVTPARSSTRHGTTTLGSMRVAPVVTGPGPSLTSPRAGHFIDPSSRRQPRRHLPRSAAGGSPLPTATTPGSSASRRAATGAHHTQRRKSQFADRSDRVVQRAGRRRRQPHARPMKLTATRSTHSPATGQPARSSRRGRVHRTLQCPRAPFVRPARRSRSSLRDRPRPWPRSPTPAKSGSTFRQDAALVIGPLSGGCPTPCSQREPLPRRAGLHSSA